MGYKKRYGAGDIVKCRLFNTPEGKFYGDYFEAEILQINWKTESYRNIRKLKGNSILVKRLSDGHEIWIQQKELKTRLKERS